MPDSEGIPTTGDSRSTARDAPRTDGVSASRAARWVCRFKPLASPKLRLFCFPPAGGDANIFRDWQAWLPDGVEVIGIQYPGRGRNREALLRSCEDVVSALLALLPPSLGTDFAFFGHSNGALISFELARSLGVEHRQRMRHHFLSACPAPHLARERPRTSELSDDEFVRKLRDMGGTPRQVLDDAKLMRMLLPRLRADFHVGETYVFRPGAVLGCDLTLLRGSQDLAVDGARVLRWAELTTGRWTEHVVDGDHFFVTSHAAEVVGRIGATLSDRVLARDSERAVRA